MLDLKMEESENPTDFYNNFEKLVNELKNAVDLITLNNNNNIVDAVAEKDKTVEFVKSKLEFEFKKRHGESENSRSNAFTFEKRKEEKMDRNLISFAKVTDNYKVVSIGDSSKIYNKDNKIIAIAWKSNRIYKMTSYLEKNIESNLIRKDNGKMSLKDKWHRTLGHVNFNYLNTMCKNHTLEGLPSEIESDYYKCATCIENKIHNIPFENKRKRAKDILEIVHTDLNGPHSEGYKGEKYFQTFIDDYSKLAKIYPIKSKGEVYDKFEDCINLIENTTGKKIKKQRCDNGIEVFKKRYV